MFAIFTLDGLVQIVETAADTRRECRDLAKLGCDVWFYQFADGIDIEAWVDANPGMCKRPGKSAGVIGSGKLLAAD